MTKKLFYDDSHMKGFTATVIGCRGKGEYYEVVLDRTAFFPEGGGQYGDTGLLGEIEVTDVKERGGVVYHLTCAPIEEGQEVLGKIDWHTRFMKMQQHTGEHIISGLVSKRFGYNNVGFHLGSTDCTMDYDGQISLEQLRELEELANEAVFANIEVLVTYPSREELSSLEYRSKIEIEGQVRIVEVPGYDVCACCAPHVKWTGEVGLVKLTGVQKYKGGVRITMLCGYRALYDYRHKEEYVKNIGVLLSAKEEETFQAVKRLKEEFSLCGERLARARKTLLSYRVEEVKLKSQGSFVCLFERELEGDELRVFVNMILEQGVLSCAVFSHNQENDWRYVIGSKTQDMRIFAKELNEQFLGRGGGKPEMVQGTIRGNEGAVREWVNRKVRDMQNG